MGKAEEAKAVKDDGHFASYDWFCALEDATVSLMGSGLDQYLHDGPLPVDVVPKGAFLTMDWCQVQWRVLWFLRNRVKLSIEGIMETTHRRENDLKLAAEESHYDIVKRKGVVVCNVTYGPWNGGGFMQDMSETALDLAENMKPNDFVLLHFWPLCISCLRLPPEEHGVEGRMKFIVNLPYFDSLRKKSEKSSYQKWGSVRQSWVETVDPYLGPDLVVGTHLALRKKWIVSLDDLAPPSCECDSAVVAIGLEEDDGPPAARAKAKGKAKAKPKLGKKRHCEHPPLRVEMQGQSRVCQSYEALELGNESRGRRTQLLHVSGHGLSSYQTVLRRAGQWEVCSDALLDVGVSY
jgi:hypothetical protein